MEAKKSPKADLTKKTGLFLNIGLVISLSVVIMAFEWKFYDEGALMDLGQVTDEFEDVMEIPPTEQPPPPPPKLQQPEIIEVPDEEEIERILDGIPDPLSRCTVKFIELLHGDRGKEDFLHGITLSNPGIPISSHFHNEAGQ